MKIQKWLFLFCLLSVFACKKNKQEAASDPSLYRNYILAYPKNEVSRNEFMKIIFTKALAPNMEAMPELNTSVLGVYPAHELEMVWENTSTLAFKPKKAMDWGAVYYYSLNMQKLFPNISDELAFFNFNTKTHVFEVNMTVRNNPIFQGGDANQYDLEGTLYLPEAMPEISEADLISSLIARQEGESRIVQMLNYDPNVRSHKFLIKGIERRDSHSKLEIRLDNTVFNASNQTKRTVNIPAKGEFIVTDVAYSRNNPKEINVFFSEPLDENQSLEGLMGVRGFSGISFLKKRNQVTMFLPSAPDEAHNVFVTTAVRSQLGGQLKEEIYYEINSEDAEPEIALLSVGGIIPPSDGELLLPIKTINLQSVVLEIFKIYPNNALQFFQTGGFDNNSDYYMNYVGEIVKQVEIDLSAVGETPYINTWHNYALDLNDYITVDPGALYEVRLTNRFQDILLDCEEKQENRIDLPKKDDQDAYISVTNYRFYNDDYFYNRDYDICEQLHYGPNQVISKLVLGSNQGLIVKMNESNDVFGVVTDLSTANPVSDATVTFYDYIQQPIHSFVTDNRGFFAGTLSKDAFVAVVKKENDINYLKIQDGASLSMSSYDVSGYNPKDGLKGYFYGDRGVWRPGDSVYMNFVLFDTEDAIPDFHPVEFTVRDSRGKEIYKTVSSEHVGNIYAFPFQTSAEAPTGSYTIAAKVGNQQFSKVIKIETVKPNRLNALIELPEELKASQLDQRIGLQLNWLHGAAGKNLKVKLSGSARSTKPSFKKYTDFVFTDPSLPSSIEFGAIDEKTTDQSGAASINLDIAESLKKAPGFMRGLFEINSYEEGGDFSTQYRSVNISPYRNYVGVKIPEGRYGGSYLYDDNEMIEFLVVDEAGNPQANVPVKFNVYALKWSWWYQRNQNALSRFADDNYQKSIASGNLTTDANGYCRFEVKGLDRGPHFIKASIASGHSSGGRFYKGSSWYYFENMADVGKEMRESASQLLLKTDKKSYTVGDDVTVDVPTSKDGKMLVTLENGSSVLDRFWVQADKGQTRVRFNVRPEMAPNVYIHATYLQPHGTSENDLPIRMYGVQSIEIQDNDNILKPKIQVAEKVEPNKDLVVTVGEEERRPMAYTLAVVDEGLLSLTNFKTPNPYDYFYSKEALGIKTWDLYNEVVGGFAGRLDAISTGGDEEAINPNNMKRANRFKPVAQLLGPFYTNGSSKKHTVSIPNYLGSVRVMVTAVSEKAFGGTEANVLVNKPVMGLTTLPRVLNIGSNLKVPVTVFVNEKGFENVNVTVKSKNALLQVETPSKQVSFDGIGEKTIYFDALADGIGIENVEIIVSSNGKTSKETVEIDVINPNPPVAQTEKYEIPAGSSQDIPLNVFGVNGSNKVGIEVSHIKPINLSYHLKHLIGYPHGCVEQTTSKAFPQLFVNNIYPLNTEQAREVEKNVKAAIQKLTRFQNSSGGFSYWPGDAESNDWATSYAGHFLLRAKEMGYAVPVSMLDNWMQYQFSRANNWSNEGAHYQVYRLYTLALSGNPSLSAMNRVKEQGNLRPQDKIWLAGAYGLAGKAEVAKNLLSDVDQIKDYREISYSYGSGLRDRAMALEALLQVDKNNPRIQSLMKDISKDLNSASWLSTQEAAVSFAALGQYAKMASMDGGGCTLQLDGKTIPVNIEKLMAVYEQPLEGTQKRTITVENTGSKPIFVNVMLEGQTMFAPIAPASSGISMDVVYQDMNGKTIDIASIEQGTDFKAIASVRNLNSNRYGRLEDLVLEMVFPSGWEIKNRRIGGAQETGNWDYQDIRDDRVYTYFGLNRGQQKTFVFYLNAAYIGKYQLPAQIAKAMYDERVKGNTANKSVQVLP